MLYGYSDKIRKNITPRGDGNLHYPLKKNVQLIIRKNITPRGDGNLNFLKYLEDL